MPGIGRPFQKGHVANPNGRPKTSITTILKDQKQKDFLEIFYPLLDKTPTDLKSIADDLDSTNIQRIAARLIYDCIAGNDNARKTFLGLMGFDMKNPQINMHIARYLVTEDGTPQAVAEEQDQTNVHAQVVRLIKDVGSKNGNR